MTAEPVQPNRGATVPDVVAVGKEQVSRAEWLAKQGINPEDRIQLKKLSHMRYQHPDLDQIQAFMIGTFCSFLSCILRNYSNMCRFWNANCEKNG